MSALPPHDLELERAVIGAVLISQRVLPVLAVDEHLTAAAFYDSFHRAVWQAMLGLHHAGNQVDVLTVRQALKGDQEKVARRLDDLADAVPGLGGVRDYARRLVELADWRTVREASLELAQSVEGLDRERRQRAEQMLAARGPSSTGEAFTEETLRDALWEHLNDGDDVVQGFDTPFSRLNAAMGGLRPTETTLLGGWTSHGKSVVADQILTHVARAGHRVHLYINEMTPKVRGLRVLSQESGVPLRPLLSRGSLSPQQTQTATKALNRGMPFGITHIAGWGADDIARELQHRKWDVAVVDIVHAIEHHDERDLADISSRLTTAARLTGTHLIMAVHLNEERAKTSLLPAPVLRDIRGSGMLKNDADNVLFVHREDEMRDGVAVLTDAAALYLKKCRNGALGGTALTFDGAHVRFKEAA